MLCAWAYPNVKKFWEELEADDERKATIIKSALLVPMAIAMCVPVSVCSANFGRWLLAHSLLSPTVLGRLSALFLIQRGGPSHDHLKVTYDA
jgi:hypothetical protein